MEIQQLKFQYRNQKPLLQDITLTLAPGDIVLIAGETGSGKSTLLNCLAGISPAYTGGAITGDITVNATSILTQSVQERSRWLGCVLQNVETQLFTDQVIQEVYFGLENIQYPATDIMPTTTRILQEFGLAKQETWPLKQLSAGQKQRLVLACVLAMQQPMLLLDEPFAYLDQAGCEFLVKVLQQRAALGQALLIVEHRTELLQAIATRTYYLQEGRLQPGLPPMPDPVASLPNTVRGELALTTTQLGYGSYPDYPDLQLHQGETLLLQGGNGSGKTTFMKLVSGLIKPTRGTITIQGKEATRLRVAQRAQTIGYVLQNPNHQLFAESVYQELMQPGTDPAWTTQLLEQLNLAPLADQHPQALSQGQKRRLALGAVLARRPALCLLDEITVGQDANSLALMVQTLQEFTRTGGALLLTSHDPDPLKGARVVTLH